MNPRLEGTVGSGMCSVVLCLQTWRGRMEQREIAVKLEKPGLTLLDRTFSPCLPSLCTFLMKPRVSRCRCIKLKSRGIVFALPRCSCGGPFPLWSTMCQRGSCEHLNVYQTPKSEESAHHLTERQWISHNVPNFLLPVLPSPAKMDEQQIWTSMNCLPLSSDRHYHVILVDEMVRSYVPHEDIFSNSHSKFGYCSPYRRRNPRDSIAPGSPKASYGRVGVVTQCHIGN